MKNFLRPTIFKIIFTAILLFVTFGGVWLYRVATAYPEQYPQSPSLSVKILGFMEDIVLYPIRFIIIPITPDLNTMAQNFYLIIFFLIIYLLFAVIECYLISCVVSMLINNIKIKNTFALLPHFLDQKNKEAEIVKKVFIKNIIVLLISILGASAFILFIFLFVFSLTLGLVIEECDTKEDKERAKYYYEEQNKKYEMSNVEPFKMIHIYNFKTNTGFFSGGGFLENNCWERYIRDTWGNQGTSISLCENEKITKEKLETLNNFWKEYDKIFRSKDKVRDDYFKEYVNSMLKNSD